MHGTPFFSLTWATSKGSIIPFPAISRIHLSDFTDITSFVSQEAPEKNVYIYATLILKQVNQKKAHPMLKSSADCFSLQRSQCKKHLMAFVTLPGISPAAAKFLF